MATPLYNAHPPSAPGDFYVVHSECVTCGAPHAVAPDLIGWADGQTSHCIWNRQPETADEVEKAIAVFKASCVGCHRYAGNDPQIIKRIGSDYCDAPQPPPFRLLRALFRKIYRTHRCSKIALKLVHFGYLDEMRSEAHRGL